MSVQIPDDVMRYLNVERALPAWAVQYLGLGWNAERRAIAIPIEGETKFRSLLAYDPVTGAIESSPNKMWWAARTSEGPLPPYPSWNDWRDDDCEVICEGELDAACAIAHGILAVSGTAGAGTFLDDWASALTGQSRTLLYDAGRAGRDGAIKAAEKLTWAGCRVRIASWPDDAPDGYDVTDFFRTGGSADEFRAILAAAKDYERQLDAKKYLRRRVVAA